MTTTPDEPFEDPDVTPSGDPDASPEPVGPGADPGESLDPPPVTPVLPESPQPEAP
jgi:hypothetical protein